MDLPRETGKRKRSEDVFIIQGGRSGDAGVCASLEGPSSSGGSPLVEVQLPGHDDPLCADQYTTWRERLFIDVWLQVRTPSTCASARRHGGNGAQR
jgi:hypothetical protein